MSDRNLDYDYASKQRVLFDEHYQPADMQLIPREGSFLWTAASGTAGEDYPIDGSDDIFFMLRGASDTVTYQAYDGVNVARLTVGSTTPTSSRFALFPSFPKLTAPDVNLRLSGKFRAASSPGGWFAFPTYTLYRSSQTFTLFGTEDGYAGAAYRYFAFDNATQIMGPQVSTDVYGHVTWDPDEWIEIVIEVLADNTYRGKCWQPPTETEPTTWEYETQIEKIADMDFYMSALVQFSAYGQGSVLDVAYVGLELF